MEKLVLELSEPVQGKELPANETLEGKTMACAFILIFAEDDDFDSISLYGV